MTRSEQVSSRLKLQQLKVLLAVAHAGGMARAAKQLAISQSVVSKAIAELEDVLGVRLFDRNSRGVEPTLYCHSLLRRSIAIFDELKTGVGEIEFLADPGVGELRIGTTDPQTGIVCAVIQRLSRQYPRLDFKIVQAEGRTLIERELRGRRIDVMVAPLPTPSIGEDLATTFLYNNRLRVVVGMKSQWARRRKVTLSDLIDEPWCSTPLELAGGAAFLSAFRASGLPRPRVVVSGGVEHIRRLLFADGRYVGVFSDGVLSFDTLGSPLKVLPIELPAPSFPIAVLTLKNRTLSPAVQLSSIARVRLRHRWRKVEKGYENSHRLQPNRLDEATMSGIGPQPPCRSIASARQLPNVLRTKCGFRRD
jgi:DNA-binding transcriptional LysR family regulator